MSKKETSIIYRENHRPEMKILNDKRVYIKGEYQPVVKIIKIAHTSSYYLRRKQYGNPINKNKNIKKEVEELVVSRSQVFSDKLEIIYCRISNTSCLSEGYGDLISQRHALIIRINNL